MKISKNSLQSTNASWLDTAEIHNNIHLDAALLASMVELLMVLLPDEYCEFLDSRDTEIFMLEFTSSYHRSRRGRKGAP